jgi:hypothetical protein
LAAPKVAPQSVDFVMSTASTCPFFRSDCRNVT